jgi:hypothetical protein
VFVAVQPEAWAGGPVNDHTTRFHARHILGREQLRRRTAGDEGHGNDDVYVAGLLKVDLGRAGSK